MQDQTNLGDTVVHAERGRGELLPAKVERAQSLEGQESCQSDHTRDLQGVEVTLRAGEQPAHAFRRAVVMTFP